jgi:hypothetical protein
MSKDKKKKPYKVTKNTIKRGTHPGVVLDILTKEGVRDMNPQNRKKYVIQEYNNLYGVPSRQTKRDNLKEYYVYKNQKNRSISLLEQDGNKVDIIAGNYNEVSDIVEITIAQQKGGSGSFNTSSEEKTLESMFDLSKTGYDKYFNNLPDELNPNKNGKKYKIDFVIGMMTACGEKGATHENGAVVKYLSGNEYLLYLGLEITIVELFLQINQDDKLNGIQKDTVSECCDFAEVYNECIKLLKYD